ncbi:MAG: AAA family ATPase [Betaproteobacteria bacterium]|jgi:type II secretory pathway predicted ATPase ExeA
MYYEHFGLKEPPFRITPNTDFFFGGGNRGPILEALIYAISQGEGIVKVTGEVGSGKTMLCSMLQTRLPENVETIYLANPSVLPEEIVHAIAFELQLDLPRGTGRLSVMHALQDHLLKRHAEGRRVVLFVEESQGMPIATLEEIRLLSNLDTKSDKLLQIVLFGQPELDENLRENQIRQLKERITHSFRLEPLTVAETREYLMFRMRAAGYRGPDLFSDAIVREIARISGGLTRRINLIADKALLAAFADNTHTLHQKHLDAAVRDSEFAREPAGAAAAPARPRWPLGAALVVAGMAAGAGIYSWWISRAAESVAPVAVPAPAPAATAALVVAPQQNEISSNKTDSYEDKVGASPAQQPPLTEPTAAPVVAAAPAPTKTPDPAPKATGKLLRERLAATEQWLAQSTPQTYTVQLLGADNEIQLNQHLRFIANIIEINNVFVYRTLAKGEPALTLTWGSFDNPRAAREAMAKLPPALKQYRPLLRTVQGIRTEIASNNPS